MKIFYLQLILVMLFAGCVCSKEEKTVISSPKNTEKTDFSTASEPGEPKIIETIRMEDGSIKMTWRSEKGAKYEVLSTTSTDAAKAEWKVEATIDAAEGEKTSWTDVKASDSAAKLYRIRKVKTAE